MRYTYKECCKAAEEATERSRYYIFRCNKRNGYITLYHYSKVTQQFLGYEFCGTAKEVYTYLIGALNTGIKIYEI